jgi:hypothetical protein
MCYLGERVKYFLYPGDEGRTFIQNTGTYLPDYVASYPMKTRILIVAAVRTSNLKCFYLITYLITYQQIIHKKRMQ